MTERRGANRGKAADDRATNNGAVRRLIKGFHDVAFMLGCCFTALAIACSSQAARADGDTERGVGSKRVAAAVALKVVGTVRIEGAEQRATPLDPLAILYSGDRLLFEHEARVEVMGRDGRLAMYSKDLTLSATSEDPASTAFDSLVANGERIKPIVLSNDSRGSGDLELVPVPLTPRMRIREGRPEFTWFERKPGLTYRLRIERRIGKQRLPIVETSIGGGRWRASEETDPFEPGVYEYHVEVIASSPVDGVNDKALARSDSASFVVLDGDEARKIAALLKTHQADNSRQNAWLDHFLRGVFLQSNGVYLLLDAHHEYELALEEIPGDRGIIEQLRHLERMIGWPEWLVDELATKRELAAKRR